MRSYRTSGIWLSDLVDAASVPSGIRRRGSSLLNRLPPLVPLPFPIVLLVVSFNQVFCCTRARYFRLRRCCRSPPVPLGSCLGQLVSERAVVLPGRFENGRRHLSPPLPPLCPLAAVLRPHDRRVVPPPGFRHRRPGRASRRTRRLLAGPVAVTGARERLPQQTPWWNNRLLAGPVVAPGVLPRRRPLRLSRHLRGPEFAHRDRDEPPPPAVPRRPPPSARPSLPTRASSRLVDSGRGCATGPTSSGPPRKRETPWRLTSSSTWVILTLFVFPIWAIVLGMRVPSLSEWIQKLADKCTLVNLPRSEPVGAKDAHHDLLIKKPSEAPTSRAQRHSGGEFERLLGGEPVRLYVPFLLRPWALHAVHTEGCHLGEDVTLASLERYYFWIGMSDSVRWFIKHCIVCQASKTARRKPKWPLISLPLPSRSGEKVAFDTLGPLPTTKRGNKYVLLVVDVFSRHAEPYALSADEKTAQGCASKLADDYCTRWGCPVYVLSDRGLRRP